jgi:glycine oxidase
MPDPDVIIIGGGILGVATAATLAENEQRVLLLERAGIGAGASGRNSGIVQHTLDPVLEQLHLATLELYRRLDAESGGAIGLGPSPVGLLSVTHDPAAARAEAAALQRDHGHLAPVYLDPDELRALEPAFAPGVAACRLDIGYPVRPIAATQAYAARARALGVVIREGIAASPWIEGSTVRGVRLSDGSTFAAGGVVVAAGPWSPALVDPTDGWRPIRPLWGVVVGVGLSAPPRHVAEEAAPMIQSRRGEEEDETSGVMFSLVTAGGASSLGSTFLEREPDAEALARRIVTRGASFVPEVATAPHTGLRACARPLSLDGRPLIGAIGGRDGLWIAAGHGPWGISTGPGSAALLADLMLGRTPAPPPELDPGRFGAPG